MGIDILIFYWTFINKYIPVKIVMRGKVTNKFYHLELKRNQINF